MGHEKPRENKANSKPYAKSVNPEICLAQFRRILGVISLLGFVIVGTVLRFDPPTAVWLAWGISFIALFDSGLYLHDLLPSYQAGTWVLLGLIWFIGFLYAQQLAEHLACPAVEYRGRLIASALPSPRNPCLEMKERLMRTEPAGRIKPFSADTVFLFLGSETSYIQSRGRWPVINNQGHVLLSADFDEKGLAVSTQIYDEQGTLQARVDDNEVNALSPDICVKRPDLSTLIINDRETKEERFYVHYLNRHAVEFRGLLHYPALAPVEITKEQIRLGGGSTISGGCLPATSQQGMLVIQ